MHEEPRGSLLSAPALSIARAELQPFSMKLSSLLLSSTLAANQHFLLSTFFPLFTLGTSTVFKGKKMMEQKWILLTRWVRNCRWTAKDVGRGRREEMVWLKEAAYKAGSTRLAIGNQL